LKSAFSPSVFTTRLIPNRSDLHSSFTWDEYLSRERTGRRPIVNPFDGARPKLRTVLLALAGTVLVAVTLFRIPLATVFALGVLLICPLMMVGMHGGRHTADRSAPDEVRIDPTDRTGEDGGADHSALASLPQAGTGRNANGPSRDAHPPVGL
jgi:Protein of unknown function (DUF2933)